MPTVRNMYTPNVEPKPSLAQSKTGWVRRSLVTKMVAQTHHPPCRIERIAKVDRDRVLSEIFFLSSQIWSRG